MTTTFLHGIEVIQIDEGTRPIQTVRSSVIALLGTAPNADAEVFPLLTPVLLKGRAHASKLGLEGTLASSIDGIWDQTGAVIVVIRAEEVKTNNKVDTEKTLTEIVKAVPKLLEAMSITGVTPRILIAPGFTHTRPLKDGKAQGNPVIAEMVGVAERLRATIIADGPNTTLDKAKSAAGDSGSDRVYMVDPFVNVFVNGEVVEQPASSRVAGLIAKTDNDNGFWFSPSNRAINGIVGTARAIPFGLSDTNSEANMLNENKVATIIRKEGFRLWGNRTLASDPQWAFLSVRRTADMIYESVEQAMLWALDKPFSGQLLRDITGSVEAYLRELQARGAILGSRVWLDTELNTKESLMAGKLYIDFDIEPPAPLERLTFRAYRNNGYYQEVVNNFATA